jgi:uncharacterized membrane protein
MTNAINRFAAAFQRHWLALLIGILLAYSLLPFVAPVLKWMGADGLAQVIYQPYKGMCHTYGFRSFFLFGSQVVYSRDEFDQQSGIDTSNISGPVGLLQSREFQGNPQMGYKTALCQRDIAIYFSMAVAGMIFAVSRRTRPISWPLLILIGIVPIGLDGFSQLLSQPPFNFIPYRESVWWLRVLTGALFGFSIAWLVFPLIEGAIRSAMPDASNMALKATVNQQPTTNNQ